MKYFFGTEFLEGTQKTFFGKTKPTIDLISIGLVAEDGRQYYAISKDFNLREAWNRFDLKKLEGSLNPKTGKPYTEKVYWIRDNVLLSIYYELRIKRRAGERVWKFSYSNLKYLIKEYGKPNTLIAKEIEWFINLPLAPDDVLEKSGLKPEFYGYYSDYDWVVFCWLFGKMIDLPRGFPMHCRDIKQMLDEKISNENLEVPDGLGNMVKIPNTKDKLKIVKALSNYPKKMNAHNALADAKWNKELYKFIEKL